MPRPGPAFSNGTMWEMWSYHWCDRCLVDAPFRNGISRRGCPLILTALDGEIPDEWFTQTEDDEIFGNYTCINFRAPGGGSSEPRPKPEPPQDGLFPRPERAVRMLLPLIGDVPAGKQEVRA